MIVCIHHVGTQTSDRLPLANASGTVPIPTVGLEYAGLYA